MTQSQKIEIRLIIAWLLNAIAAFGMAAIMWDSGKATRATGTVRGVRFSNSRYAAAKRK